MDNLASNRVTYPLGDIIDYPQTMEQAVFQSTEKSVLKQNVDFVVVVVVFGLY